MFNPAFRLTRLDYVCVWGGGRGGGGGGVIYTTARALLGASWSIYIRTSLESEVSRHYHYKRVIFLLYSQTKSLCSGQLIRPIAHWRPFKIRRQASTPGDRAGRATDTRCQRLYSHASNTRTHQFSARCSINSKALTRLDKSSKWLHPASPSIKTITGWCFAAGVDAVMLRSVEKANKRRRTVRSGISFKLTSSLRSASFDVST